VVPCWYFFVKQREGWGNLRWSDVMFARQQVDNPLYIGSAMFIFPLGCADSFRFRSIDLFSNTCYASRSTFRESSTSSDLRQIGVALRYNSRSRKAKAVRLRMVTQCVKSRSTSALQQILNVSSLRARDPIVSGVSSFASTFVTKTSSQPVGLACRR
jgi:hypothetical protein